MAGTSTHYEIPLIQREDGRWVSEWSPDIIHPTAAAAATAADWQINVCIRTHQGSGVVRMLLDQTGSPVYAAILAAMRQAPRDGRVCADCGAGYDGANVFCPLSDEGEGEHNWIERETITAEDAAFILRHGEHMEKSAMEHD